MGIPEYLSTSHAVNGDPDAMMLMPSSFMAVRFHRVPAQVFSLKPVEPLFSSGIPN